MDSNRTCPECHLSFEAELPATGVLVCPLCDSAFAELMPAGPVPTAAPSPSTASARQMLRGVATVGVILIIAAGMGYAYYLLGDIDHKPDAASAPATHALPEPSPPAVEDVPVIPNEPMRPVRIPQQPWPLIQPLPPVRIHRQLRLSSSTPPQPSITRTPKTK